MEDALRRVVAGLTTFLTEFDGPATAYIGTGEFLNRYVTLCSNGVKPEGESTPFYGWQEAIERYGEQLGAMITENADKQLAWRRRPSLDCNGLGQYRVTSRLVFI